MCKNCKEFKVLLQRFLKIGTSKFIYSILIENAIDKRPLSCVQEKSKEIDVIL